MIRAVLALLLLAVGAVNADELVRLREDQFLFVDGRSIREFSAQLDCARMTIDWGPVSSQFPIGNTERLGYVAPKEWSFSGHPMSATAKSREDSIAAMEACKALEEQVFEKLRQLCQTSADDRELQQFIDEEFIDGEFQAVIQSAEISWDGFLEIRFRSAPANLLSLSPSYERVSAGRTAPPDPCTLWERRLAEIVDQFRLRPDGLIHAVIVDKAAYGVGSYRTREEMCESLGRVLTQDGICAGSGGEK